MGTTTFFGKDYFEEQLARIRDIRSSERRMDQKITDIYAQCSADYSPVWIFRTLMATRGNKISLEHVQALNMIDLFFERRDKEKAIIEKWDEYLDHLNQAIKDDDKDYQVKLEQWTARGDDMLADMLQLMGKSLGYDFDKVRIRKAIYVPRGHGDVDLENRVIRRGIAEIVIGKKSLPVSVHELNQTVKDNHDG